MDVAGLVQSMIENDAFYRLINDPLAQFGAPEEPFLGAEIMPERPVLENAYTEEGIRYRTPIANHGTRYSPAQLKEGMIIGSFKVELGDSDIAAEMTGQQYDQFVRLLQRAYGQPGRPAAAGGGVRIPTMDAMKEMLKWADLALVRPLHARNEADRWAAICNAQVVMHGDNGFQDTVTYPNPTGHRVAAGGTWSNNSYDPWADIIARAEFLRSKGYTLARQIIPSQVLTILANNLNMRLRAGHLNVTAAVVTGIAGRLSIEQLNTLASMDGLPPFTLYDKQYFTQLGGATTVTSLGYTLTGNWYYPRDTLTMICKTGRNEEIDRGDLEPVVMHDTLGYVGIGRPAGQADVGMVVEVEAKSGKPPRIEGQAWQTSLPVMTDPEAMATIYGIA